MLDTIAASLMGQPNGAPGKPCALLLSKGNAMAWHRSSRHDRGYDANWVKLRKLVLQWDKHLCQPCKRAGRVTQATEVDHITPKSCGGDDSADNLQSICRECHKTKTQDEAAEAQGRKPRLSFDANGYPVWGNP